MKKLKHYIDVIERRTIRRVLSQEKLARWLSTHCLKMYLSLFYFNWQKIWPDMNNPQNLNHWLLKVSVQNSKNPKMRQLVPLCVDKYAVREYIEGKGFGDTLNEIIGIYESVEEINWESLPNQFVMKMTNASGRNYICADKLGMKEDWNNVKEQFSIWLEDHSFAWWTGEWQYSLIKPRIVIEKYLHTIGEESPIDYKFNCINGKVFSCFVAYNRDPKDAHSRQVCFDDYDLSWNRTDAIKDEWHMNRKLIAKPINYDKMIDMAEKCCQGFPFCRFDLYEIDGKILFGEMTFTPQGNVLEFYKDEWLEKALIATR